MTPELTITLIVIAIILAIYLLISYPLNKYLYRRFFRYKYYRTIYKIVNKKDYRLINNFYFKIDENSGETIFSIDKEQAKDILESKFEEENKKYKSIELLENKKIEKYNNDDLKNMINKNGNVYYYFSVKIGWFRAKETYVINMYDRTLYQLVNDEVQSF